MWVGRAAGLLDPQTVHVWCVYARRTLAGATLGAGAGAERCLGTQGGAVRGRVSSGRQYGSRA